jgi:outer membrane lipoprotein
MRWISEPTRRIALLIALALPLGGCISAFPDEVMQGVDRKLTVAELRAAPPGSHVNRRVLAGGEIIGTRPTTGMTEIELLSRRLRVDDSPEQSDRSEGRVLVRSRSFLDPAVFAPGRRITVVGTITGAEERRLGDLPYVYPVIEVERIRLWPVAAAYPTYYDPYWPYGGPYWRPYPAWGPWPHRWW